MNLPVIFFTGKLIKEESQRQLISPQIVAFDLFLSSFLLKIAFS